MALLAPLRTHPPRLFVALGLLAAGLLGSAPSAAAPRDALAMKALSEAMEVDYLNTQFDKAEQKLRKAIDVCGAAGCSPEVKAKLYVALGSVLAAGKKQLEDAKDSFIEALKLDKNAALDPDVASSEIAFAFERARAELKLGPGGAASTPPLAGSAGIAHTPVAEQRVSTPVPLFVEVGKELLPKVKKVSVSYLAPGASEWRSLVLKKVGASGFGINVPCTDLKAEGTLQYHVTAMDEAGAVLGTAGTRAQPITTTIKPTLSGEPPHWPGFAPPEQCGAVEAGPKQCIDDRQCNPGFGCERGECRPKAPAAVAEAAPKNLVSVGFSPDFSLVSGERVCTAQSQQENNWACFREDGSRYVGAPTLEGDAVGNRVGLGPALSTLRVHIGYDRRVLDNVTLGGRLGFAFNGAPAGASFLPLHLEVRGAYWFGQQPFARLGARPFVFASGGLAQFDTRAQPEVLEDGRACEARNASGELAPDDRSAGCTKPSQDGRVEKRIQKLDAYKQAGFGFVGLGGGLQYQPLPGLSFNVAARVSVTIPVLTLVMSPEVGATLGF